MKRSFQYTGYKRKRSEPTVFSWLLLLLAWIAVVPLCCFILQRKGSNPSVVQAMSVSSKSALHLALAQNISVNQTAIDISCAVTDLPSVNALRSNEPTILIYHTHTTEAYTQTESETYRETSKWRTNDNTRNVVAVGEALKEILERDYGFHVIHDTTDHEPPKLASAYERSLVTMETYHKEYPSVVLFIDLHRDAYHADEAPCDYLMINGTETAKLMLVVGKGEKYADKPYYESNVRLAERITEHLNTIDEKLCRSVRIKTGRYNQHVAPNCILVEAGHNANTLSQAKAAMPYLAEAIAYSFRTGEIKSTDWLPN